MNSAPPVSFSLSPRFRAERKRQERDVKQGRKRRRRSIRRRRRKVLFRLRMRRTIEAIQYSRIGGGGKETRGGRKEGGGESESVLSRVGGYNRIKEREGKGSRRGFFAQMSNNKGGKVSEGGIRQVAKKKVLETQLAFPLSSSREPVRTSAIPWPTLIPSQTKRGFKTPPGILGLLAREREES